MNLTGIVSVTGKPGLYKVIGQNKSGFILETLDEARNKLLINPNTRIAALKEITIFGQDEDIRLQDVLETMKQQAGELTVPDPKADNKTLKEYFGKIAPDHDSDRVYVSDIKKMVSWYGILSPMPLFDEAEEEAGGESASSQKQGAVEGKEAGAEKEINEGKPVAEKQKEAND